MLVLLVGVVMLFRSLDVGSFVFVFLCLLLCLLLRVVVSAALNFLRRELKDRSTTFGEEEDGLEGKRLRLE